MKCYSCQRKPDFTCPCSFTPLCPEHLTSHLSLPGPHSIEHLNIPLENSLSLSLKKEVLNRIKLLQGTKEKLASLSKNLIKKILSCRGEVDKELNNLINYYFSLISFEKISNSLKTEVEKVLATCLRIKEFNMNVGSQSSKIFPEGLISYGESETAIRKKEEIRQAEIKRTLEEECRAKQLKIQGYNSLDIEGKKQLMDSMNNNAFNNDFGKSSGKRDKIKEILFSMDGKFSFICKSYLGIFK